MRPDQVLSAIIGRSGLSQREFSKCMGNAGTWASTLIRKGSVSRIDTIADAADIAGIDIALVDRKTGMVIDKVAPPRRGGEDSSQIEKPMTVADYMAVKYPIEALPNLKEGGYTVKFPDLDGCVVRIESLTEMAATAEDARRAWIETALENGMPIPLPGTGTAR